MKQAEKTYELMVCGWNGNPRHCVYLNDTRIAGTKPWGGSDEARAWQITLKDLADAIPEIRELLASGVIPTPAETGGDVSQEPKPDRMERSAMSINSTALEVEKIDKPNPTANSGES